MDESLEKSLTDRFSFYHIPDENIDDLFCSFDFLNVWYTLIEDMSIDIRNLIESKYPDIEDFSISYMKEKYGTLRVFSYGCPDDVDYIISQAENDSEHICEQCGEPSKLRMLGGWVYNRCDKCWSIIQEINKK